ncbi:MAG: ATP-binding cassette domain-containing protein [Synergistales bacterium]|nr:ATP-binding cassette domain-containing protein [Synergistales bacterium]
MTVPLLELQRVQRRYGERVALVVEHLAIERGRIVGLVGPNGSGKTTLLRLLAFLDRPDEGEILYDGRNARGREEALRRKATLLLQEPFLLKRSVFENVAYGLRVRGETSKLRSRVEESLRSVGLDPERFSRRLWFQLSGGEAQRVALAGRLILRPELLLLDEPTASVDIHSASLIHEAVLRARREWGTTLIVVSHDLAWLYDVTEEIVALYGGRVTERGPENLVAGPWREIEDGFMEHALADGQRLVAAGSGEEGSVAALDPSSVIVSLEAPHEISARNVLRGTVSQMTYENGTKRVLVKVQAGGLPLTARLTGEAVRELKLHPGREVLLVVKASAFRWV